MVKGHSGERCKECLKRILALLRKIYGDVEKDYNINLPAKLEKFEGNRYYPALKKNP